MTPKLTSHSSYSILLFLLIISLIGGAYFFNFQLFGIEFYAYRIVLFGGLVFLITTKSIHIFDSKYSKWVLFTLTLWLLYGALLLVWSPNLLLGIKELYYIGIGCITFIVFLSLKKKLTNFYDLLERYWLIGFIVVSVFLLLEFISHYHFEGTNFDKLVDLGFYHTANAVPVFIFGNPNHLAIYLCFTIVLSIYFILKGNNFLIHSLVILLSINFLLFTESRLSYLFLLSTLILLILFYVFKFVRNTMNFNFAWKKIVIVFILCGLNLALICWKYQNSQVPKKDVIVAIEPIDNYSIESGTPDYVFPIDKALKEKLRDGDAVKVEVENFTKTDFNYAELFIDSTIDKWLFYLLVLCLIIVVISFTFYASKFNGKNLIGVLTACLLLTIGIFTTHPVKRPNNDVKYNVLKEVGKAQSAIEEIETNSLSAETAAALLNGQELLVCLSKSATALDFLENGQHQTPLSGDVVRKNLILNGLVYLRKSNYLGIGPGAYISYNQQKKNKYEVGTIVSPHNFVIEIASQYGILISGFLIFLFGITFFVIVRSFFSWNWSNEHTFATVLLVCLILLGNANSRFLSLPINWVIMSFIFFVSDELIEGHKNRKSDSK
ncbi:MAG: hypothetical protein ACI9OT_001974 [Gammaproteobacteria bacterium]|jgi:hypothetical protein